MLTAINKVSNTRCKWHHFSKIWTLNCIMMLIFIFILQCLLSYIHFYVTSEYSNMKYVNGKKTRKKNSKLYWQFIECHAVFVWLKFENFIHVNKLNIVDANFSTLGRESAQIFCSELQRTKLSHPVSLSCCIFLSYFLFSFLLFSSLFLFPFLIFLAHSPSFFLHFLLLTFYFFLSPFFLLL